MKALSEYLGHADPGFTLRVYTHLMSASAERTRTAIDRVFEPASTPPEDTAASNEYLTDPMACGRLDG